LIGVLAVAVAGWLGWRWTSAPSAHRGPIVVVLIDTLRADRLPAYGYTQVSTPVIDALAADGVLFESAWAHSPQTFPSHVSIFTGRLPFEHGVRDNLGFTVKADEGLLAEMLRRRGYATGGFVSAYVLRTETGIGRGFDTYDARLPVSSPEVAIGEVQRDGADTVAAATAWINAQTSSQFFLFLHLYEPHTPYTPPARFRRFLPYDGEIAYDDELIGRLVAVLKEKGLYDPALLILLSDHGEGLGDHGEQEHGLFLYRETTQVPLIVKRPAQRESGRRVGAPVQHIDLVPTILDVVGAERPAGLRGRSLLPLLSGGAIPEQGIYAEALYARFHFAWSELYSLTDARYRLIRAPRDELYDMQQDAGERTNVAAARESARIAMRQALEKLMAGARIDEPAQVTAEDRERLKALGYVGSQATVGTQPGVDSLPDPKDKVHVLEQYRAALDLVRQGRAGDAIAAFQSLAAQNPQMADVWSELGGLLLRAGRVDESIAAYKRLVEVAPHDPSALVTVAQLLVQSGRPDEAQAQAKAALLMLANADGRWRAAAHKVLMRIALERKDLTLAREEAARAQKADPTIPLSDFVEGVIRYDAGQFEEALRYFQRAVESSRQRIFPVADLHYYYGDTLARLERYPEAERALTLEIRMFPSNLRARAARAMLYRAQGRISESDQEIDDIVRTSPGPEGYSLAVKLYTMFGETEKARAASARANAGRPRTPQPGR
jgi:arylsulfatase A-like enzyme/Tfp pilus assembly protein PilF